MSDDPRDSNPELRPGQHFADHGFAQAHEQHPNADFLQSETGLARSRVAQVWRQKLRFALVLQLAAAVAAAGLWFEHRFASRESMSAAGHAQAAALAAAPEPAMLTVSVTGLAGSATFSHLEGAAEPLRIASELREGDRVRLGNDAVAHLRVAHGSGVVLGSGTEVLLRRLRRGETEIDLARGRVTSQLAPLTAAERWLVHAAGHRIAARGTHFEVTVSGDALGVMVAQGHVAVLDGTGRPVAELRARDHFALDKTFGMRVATWDPQQAGAPLDSPRLGSVELAAWPLLTLLDVDALGSLGVKGFVLDGSRFPASGELAARVPPGDVSLSVERATLAPQTIVLHVPEAGLSLGPEALQKLLQ